MFCFGRALRLVVLGALLTLPACGTCDTDGQTPVRYTEGTTNADTTRYETNPIDGRYLDFPAGRVYDLAHDLNQTPSVVLSYLSFSAEPTSGHGDFAESAGNQVVVERVDDEVVRVRNDTCADMYLRVVLEADAPAASN
jgi:hypothetical protein